MQRARRASASEKAKELEAINGLVCGKNVLITGGAMGLGYAFVNHFLQHGAKVSIITLFRESSIIRHGANCHRKFIDTFFF